MKTFFLYTDSFGLREYFAGKKDGTNVFTSNISDAQEFKTEPAAIRTGRDLGKEPALVAAVWRVLVQDG